MASIDTACPVDCETPLPLFAFSACNAEFNLSQINYLYIMNADFPLVNWENPAEWAERLLEANQNNANAIRRLTVLGSIAEPTSTTVDRSGGRTSTSPLSYTLLADIDENNNTNYDAVRTFGCSGNYRLYYSTLGGKLYDPNAIASIKASEPLTAPKEDYAIIKLVATWSERKMPLRIDNPIA